MAMSVLEKETVFSFPTAVHGTAISLSPWDWLVFLPPLDWLVFLLPLDWLVFQ